MLNTHDSQQSLFFCALIKEPRKLLLASTCTKTVFNMCGISAVIALDTKNRDILKSEAYRKRLAHRLRKSLKAIKHRGPDARRHWISKSNRVGKEWLLDDAYL